MEDGGKKPKDLPSAIYATPSAYWGLTLTTQPKEEKIMGINDVRIPNEHPSMQIVNQFVAAYNSYDTNAMLALHTDDAIWNWIDPGKNFPQFGPEGMAVGTGKQEIRKLFDMDRGKYGFNGWILFSELQGNAVSTIELWQNDTTRAFGVPLVTKSLYRLRGNKIAEWTWVVSPETSTRLMAAVAKAGSEAKPT
ncbi:MAG: nuclear transport factor 2 family protein [Thermodesulfobacteriota bacterium]|nr:MAG: nuclear transport factor 2 family protein [Thermodesulfobacteriota bacterium]